MKDEIEKAVKKTVWGHIKKSWEKSPWITSLFGVAAAIVVVTYLISLATIDETVLEKTLWGGAVIGVLYGFYLVILTIEKGKRFFSWGVTSVLIFFAGIYIACLLCRIFESQICGEMQVPFYSSWAPCCDTIEITPSLFEKFVIQGTVKPKNAVVSYFVAGKTNIIPVHDKGNFYVLDSIKIEDGLGQFVTINASCSSYNDYAINRKITKGYSEHDTIVLEKTKLGEKRSTRVVTYEENGGSSETIVPPTQNLKDVNPSKLPNNAPNISIEIALKTNLKTLKGKSYYPPKLKVVLDDSTYYPILLNNSFFFKAKKQENKNGKILILANGFKAEERNIPLSGPSRIDCNLQLDEKIEKELISNMANVERNVGIAPNGTKKWSGVMTVDYRIKKKYKTPCAWFCEDSLCLYGQYYYEESKPRILLYEGKQHFNDKCNNLGGYNSIRENNEEEIFEFTGKEGEVKEFVYKNRVFEIFFNYKKKGKYFYGKIKSRKLENNN